MKILHFLGAETSYDFNIEDRWGNTAESELDPSLNKQFGEIVRLR
jgi:hypothetical protein